MPGVACVGVDAAGGLQLGNAAAKFKVHGAAVAVVGDAVEPHGIAPHDAAVMAQGTSKFRVNGIPVCRQGHLATCGHPTSGRPFFRIP